MNKEVKLTVSMSVITDRLKKILSKGGESNADLIAKTIVENLALTEVGLSQLMMSFMGIEEKTNWVVGDEVMIHVDHLNSWRFDESEMRNKGMLHKDHVKAKITDINLRMVKGIGIEFQGVYKDGTGVFHDKSIHDNCSISALTYTSDLVLERPDLADLL